jgi:MFS family permease
MARHSELSETIYLLFSALPFYFAKLDFLNSHESLHDSMNRQKGNLMTKRAVAVLTSGFFTIFIAYAIRYGYGLLLPEMLASLKISKTEAGIIYAAYFVAYTLFSPILGLLSDRYDMRLLLTLFTALLGGGAFSMAFAQSVASASLFFTMAGLGHAACWAPVVALVQRWVPEQRRGTALGFTSLGGSVGMAVWSVMLPFIVSHYGWQSGWFSMGVFAFLVAGLNFLLIRSYPHGHSRKNLSGNGDIQIEAVVHTYWLLLKENKLWLIGLAYLLVGFAVLVPYTFLSTYATEALAMSYGTATRFIAVIALSGMAGKLLLATWSDSLGRVKVMMICGFFMALGCLGMSCSQAAWVLFIFSALFGFGFGAVWPVYAAAAPDFFPKKTAGSVVGLWTVFLGVGSIVSPILCGWTIDRTGTYSWAFLLGTGSALGSIGLLIPTIKGGTQQS